jgi:peptidoglycan hydrolase CwlO-like protein
MEQHELLVTLKTLQSQLAETDNVDAETQRLLQTVTADIQALLDERGADKAEPSESDTSLSERLRESLIEFEVRHPHLGGLLERITAGLASIGI